jgi:prolyl-tRNA editing enzyme YbaK/EbsC (Cys-tRNA(Pro) deacylase)
VEKGIFALPRIWINGGRRGFLVELAPEELREAFQVQEVEVALIGQV